MHHSAGEQDEVEVTGGGGTAFLRGLKLRLAARRGKEVDKALEGSADKYYKVDKYSYCFKLHFIPFYFFYFLF